MVAAVAARDHHGEPARAAGEGRHGFTLDEVAELLDTGRRGHPTADLRDRATLKLVEIEQKLQDLATIRDTLRRVIDARCDSLTACTCSDCPLPFADLVGGDAQ